MLPFEVWQRRWFSPAALADPGKEGAEWGLRADPDHDGLNNLMEYALGSNPIRSELNPGLKVELKTVNGERHVQITFKKRKNDSTLAYVPEVSTDKQAWSSDASQVRWGSWTEIDAEFDWATYQSVGTISPDHPIFIRLRVLKN
jgi:hypothetical protein